MWRQRYKQVIEEKWYNIMDIIANPTGRQIPLRAREDYLWEVTFQLCLEDKWLFSVRRWEIHHRGMRKASPKTEHQLKGGRQS